MSSVVQKVAAWRPPVFKAFSQTGTMISAIFGHAFGVAIAFLMYDVTKSLMLPKDKDGMSESLRRLIAFVAAFLSSAFAFFVMWFLFGLGYKQS
jgi:high-affinity nickel permease